MNVHDGQCSLYNLECTYISHQVAYCLCIYIATAIVELSISQYFGLMLQTAVLFQS